MVLKKRLKEYIKNYFILEKNKETKLVSSFDFKEFEKDHPIVLDPRFKQRWDLFIMEMEMKFKIDFSNLNLLMIEILNTHIQDFIIKANHTLIKMIEEGIE